MPAVRGFTQSPGCGILRATDSRGSRLCFHGLKMFMQRGNSGKQGRLNHIGQIIPCTLKLKRAGVPCLPTSDFDSWRSGNGAFWSQSGLNSSLRSDTWALKLSESVLSSVEQASV